MNNSLLSRCCLFSRIFSLRKKAVFFIRRPLVKHDKITFLKLNVNLLITMRQASRYISWRKGWRTEKPLRDHNSVDFSHKEASNMTLILYSFDINFYRWVMDDTTKFRSKKDKNLKIQKRFQDCFRNSFLREMDSVMMDSLKSCKIQEVKSSIVTLF